MGVDMNQTQLSFETDYTGPAPTWLTSPDVVTEGNFGSWATFSTDRQYRYLLGRTWDTDRPTLVLGMLNPSKAGGLRDDGRPDNDPTISRCLGFAKRDRYGSLVVWNACALISTDPRELAKAQDPKGPRNLDAIAAALGAPTLPSAVVAWGRPQNVAVRRLLRTAYVHALSSGRRLYRFGKPTLNGWPRHPLYLRADTPIVECNGHP